MQSFVIVGWKFHSWKLIHFTRNDYKILPVKSPKLWLWNIQNFSIKVHHFAIQKCIILPLKITKFCHWKVRYQTLVGQNTAILIFVLFLWHHWDFLFWRRIWMSCDKALRMSYLPKPTRVVSKWHKTSSSIHLQETQLIIWCF